MVDMRLHWSRNPRRMAISLARWQVKLQHRLVLQMTKVAADMTVYAKMAHPWRNRTGRAEGTLHYTVSASGDSVTITLSHGVYYGIYLELRWGGRWGVIPAALNHAIPRVQAAMRAALAGA